MGGVVFAAATRAESRGVQWRADVPHTTDQAGGFLATVARLGADGRAALAWQAVAFTHIRPGQSLLAAEQAARLCRPRGRGGWDGGRDRAADGRAAEQDRPRWPIALARSARHRLRITAAAKGGGRGDEAQGRRRLTPRPLPRKPGPGGRACVPPPGRG